MKIEVSLIYWSVTLNRNAGAKITLNRSIFWEFCGIAMKRYSLLHIALKWPANWSRSSIISFLSIFSLTIWFNTLCNSLEVVRPHFSKLFFMMSGIRSVQISLIRSRTHSYFGARRLPAGTCMLAHSFGINATVSYCTPVFSMVTHLLDATKMSNKLK